MTLRRFSSRRKRLDHAYLSDRLKEARSYKRIAGYFRSSIFELVREETAAIPTVQIVCNSELDAADIAVSKHARDTLLKERWNEAPPEVEALLHRDRYRQLHDLLTSGRVEIRFVDATPRELPAAALAESPIYRGGEQLQSWQRSFVTLFLQHRETYGKARLLLADEVGVGKTLSLAASAMISALLDDGPVLILCPSTLTLQWQVELADKLGIPSAVWSSTKKVWLDPKGHIIKTRGPEDIAGCPFRVAIVSTGLIFHDSDERRYLLERRYGTLILDEAHRARRRGGLGQKKGEPNNLLDFMLRIALRTKHVLLGTATPIQTEVHELWDLLRILSAGADFVLGRELFGRWPSWEKSLPVVKGRNPRWTSGVPGSGCEIRCRPRRKMRSLPRCVCSWGWPIRPFLPTAASARWGFWNSRRLHKPSNRVSCGSTIPSFAIPYCGVARRWKTPVCWKGSV